MALKQTFKGEKFTLVSSLSIHILLALMIKFITWTPICRPSLRLASLTKAADDKNNPP
jgi:hypothetical protein